MVDRMMVFLSLLASFPIQAQTGDFLKHFPHKELSHQHRPCTATKEPCLDLPSAVDGVLDHGFDSRSGAEKVYEAKHRVYSRMGALLPTLNLGAMAAVINLDLFTLVSNTMGFLLPGNWFLWKSQKSLAAAELESFRSLRANQVQATEVLYININLLWTNYQITKHYDRQIQKVMDLVAQQEQQGSRQLNPEQVGVMKSLSARMRFQKEQLKSAFRDSYSDLLFAMGQDDLTPQLKWHRLTMPEIGHIKMKNIPAKESLLPQVVEQSMELKNFDHLMQAAQQEKKALVFSFLSTNSGRLGLNSVYDVEVSKTQIEQLQIEKQKAQQNLNLSLTQAYNKVKSSIEYYRAHANEVKALKGIKQTFADNMEDTKVAFDFDKALRYFELGLQADLRINAAKHLFLVGVSQLNRLLLATETYQRAIAFEYPKGITKFSKEWFLSQLQRVKSK